MTEDIFLYYFFIILCISVISNPFHIFESLIEQDTSDNKNLSKYKFMFYSRILGSILALISVFFCIYLSFKFNISFLLILIFYPICAFISKKIFEHCDYSVCYFFCIIALPFIVYNFVEDLNKSNYIDYCFTKEQCISKAMDYEYEYRTWYNNKSLGKAKKFYGKACDMGDKTSCYQYNQLIKAY